MANPICAAGPWTAFASDPHIASLPADIVREADRTGLSCTSCSSRTTRVKRIVEVHGGRVWVESEGAGHGSAFCFTIPGKTEGKNRER